MATNQIKYDDPLGFVRPVQEGRTVLTFPFLMNGDTAARIYSRSVLVRESYYVPLKPGSETDGVWPDGDQKAYSLPDGPIAHTGIGDLVKLTRSYARIPGQQITYPGSRYFPLPSVGSMGASTEMTASLYATTFSSIGSGLYLIDHDVVFIESQNALYGEMQAQTARLIGYATAGTFTLTYKASTTAALAYNAAGATIAAAINGLASIIADGLTATVNNTLTTTTGGAQVTITWTVGYAVVPVTMNAGSLTVTTSNNPTTLIVDATTQGIFLPDHYTIAGHGLNASLALATTDNNVSTLIRVFAVGYWGVIDANTIWAPSINTPILLYKFGNYLRAYKPGWIYLLRTRLTEDFFLPGVSAGITTPSDIPVTLGLQNPADLFAAIIALTGWQTYETEGPAPWLGGPIYRRAYTAINLDDFST